MSCRHPSLRHTLGLSVGDRPRVAQAMQADELWRPRRKWCCNHDGCESPSIVENHARIFLMPSQNAISAVSFGASRRKLIRWGSYRKSLNEPKRIVINTMKVWIVWSSWQKLEFNPPSESLIKLSRSERSASLMRFSTALFNSSYEKRIKLYLLKGRRIRWHFQQLWSIHPFDEFLIWRGRRRRFWRTGF
jgi:hypothetical protein